MVRHRVKNSKRNRVIYFNSFYGKEGFEHEMRDLFASEHFIKLECEKQRRPWKYKSAQPETIIDTM